MSQNVATIGRIKHAVDALHDSMDLASVDKKFNLQVGIVLAPQSGLSIEQVKTALRKYKQALGSFQDDATAALTLDITADDEDLRKVIAAAQDKVTPKAVPEAANG
jgi:hypothetical protein